MINVVKLMVISSAVFAASVPQDPSWWKEVTDDDMTLLAVHMDRAEEITRRDSATVARLYFDHQLLDAFEEVNRKMIKDGFTGKASPQEILDAIENIRNELKKLIAEEEQKNKVKVEEPKDWRNLGKEA